MQGGNVRREERLGEAGEAGKKPISRYKGKDGYEEIRF